VKVICQENALSQRKNVHLKEEITIMVSKDNIAEMMMVDHSDKTTMTMVDHSDRTIMTKMSMKKDNK
jgi:hypothetical protein